MSALLLECIYVSEFMIERKALQFFYLDLALRVPILQKWCSRSKRRLAAGLSFTIWCALLLFESSQEEEGELLHEKKVCSAKDVLKMPSETM